MSPSVLDDVILATTLSPVSALQVNDLNEQLSSTEVQRDALLSQQASSLEEAEQLRGALQASSQEVLEIREELRVAALKEAQLSRQIEEVTQQLALDQEREQAHESRLSAAINENVLKVSRDLPSRTPLDQPSLEVHSFTCPVSHTNSPNLVQYEISGLLALSFLYWLKLNMLPVDSLFSV